MCELDSRAETGLGCRAKGHKSFTVVLTCAGVTQRELHVSFQVRQHDKSDFQKSDVCFSLSKAAIQEVKENHIKCVCVCVFTKC